MPHPSDTLSDRLVAHRGYAARYPENSLLAVERALRCGARFVEVDIQLTADLQPVLYHDRDMQRLSGVEQRVQDLSYAALQSYSLSNPAAFGARFQDEPIAHLRQLVELIERHPGVTFFIECKRVAVQQAGAAAFLQTALALLQPVAAQAVIISYDAALVALAAAQGWRVGWVSDSLPQAGWQAQLGLVPEYLFLDYAALAGYPLAKQKTTWGGTQVAVYEVAEASLARQLFAQGVDLVETFAIDEMRQALAG